MHWLASVSLWTFLRQVWPEQERTVLVAALLFTVYPGFSQQPLARTYSYAWAGYAIFFLSLGLMVFAIRNQRYFWVSLVGAVILSGVALFSLDYFSGLELIRPVFLWLVLGAIEKGWKHRLKRAFWLYLPFAIVFLAFLVWRLFGFSEAMYLPDFQGSVGTDPLLFRIIKSLAAVVVYAWGKVFHFPSLGVFGLRFIAIFATIVLGVFIGTYFLLERIVFTDEIKPKQPRWIPALTWILVGLGALLVAGIPAYSIGHTVSLEFPYDRLTFPFMLGSSLLLAGILDLITAQTQRHLLVSLFLALAVGFHLQNAYQYREDWKNQREILWQLAWRAPSIELGTILLSDDASSFPYNDDEALTFMLNWMYAPENRSSSIPYGLLFATERFGNMLPEQDIPITIDESWTVSLKGSTSQALVLWYAPTACLRILDPVYDDDLVNLYLDPGLPERREVNLIRLMPEWTALALPFSRTELVLVNPDQRAQVPISLFGGELPHKWCYYFEKAELARQQADWNEVVRLGDEVFSIPYYPLDFSEYLPFIEGYTRLKRWDEAQAYTFKVAGRGPVLRPALCAIWRRAEANLELTDDDRQIIQDMKEYLGACPYP